MQVVCESCGYAGEAAGVEIVDGAVFVACASCGVRHQLGGSPPAPVAASEPAGPATERALPAEQGDVADESLLPEVEVIAVAELPPVKCPKCGHRQHDDYACHKCGLVFANVRDDHRPWESWPAELQPAVDRAEALWNEVERTPGDPARHAAFVDWCRSQGIITYAATSYRHWMADHPEDALSGSYLERVVRDAQALAQAMTLGDDSFVSTARRLKTAMLIVVIVLCVIATVALVRMVGIRDAAGIP